LFSVEQLQANLRAYAPKNSITIPTRRNILMPVSYAYTSPNPEEVGGMPMKLFVSKPEFAGGSTFDVVVG